MLEEALLAGAVFDTVIYDPFIILDNYRGALLTSVQKVTKNYYPIGASALQDLSDTEASPGVLAVVNKEDHKLTASELIMKPRRLIVVLDEINDPGNLGTIVRTCDWFAVDAVLISKNSAELYNPKVVRSAAGSIYHLPIVPNANILEFLEDAKIAGYRLYATELQESTDIRKTNWAAQSVLVIGNEARGISPAVSAIVDEHVMVPRFGKAESLNAAIACGIIISQIKLQ